MDFIANEKQPPWELCDLSGRCILDQMEVLIELFPPPESQQRSLEEQTLEELCSIITVNL